MCIDTFQHANCRMINRAAPGIALNKLLAHARDENRMVCGLMQVLAYMQRKPEDVLVCLMPRAKHTGDPATHMHTVLLQAYCYENRIPVIEVDSGQKLIELCRIPSYILSHNPFPCVIVTGYHDTSDSSTENYSPTTEEQVLADFCKSTIEKSPRSFIELPG